MKKFFGFMLTACSASLMLGSSASGAIMTIADPAADYVEAAGGPNAIITGCHQLAGVTLAADAC